jgi:hypothetical protein
LTRFRPVISVTAMAEAKRTNTTSCAAVAAFGALVALPLSILYARVALDRSRDHSGEERRVTAAQQGAAPHPEMPGGVLDKLPVFDAYGAEEAPAFPDLQLAPLSGDAPTTLSAVRSGPTILHLWSLACETCADEWPAMHAFSAARAAEKNGLPPVLSVLVAPRAEGKLGDAARAALEQTRSSGWFGRPAPELDAAWVVAEEDVLSPSEPPAPDRPITGYPETFVLDGRGRLRMRLVGPVPWDVDTWQRILAMLPGVVPGAAAPELPPMHPAVPGLTTPPAAPVVPVEPAAPETPPPPPAAPAEPTVIPSAPAAPDAAPAAPSDA